MILEIFEFLALLYPYLSILMLITFLYFFKNSYNKILFVLFIYSAIRYEVGTDYKTYYNILKENNLFQIERMEILNKLIVKLTYYLGDYQFFFIIYSLIIVFFIGLGMKKISDNKKIAIV